MITLQGAKMIIYLRDCLQAGYCVKGVKAYCKAKSIDFKKLVRHGYHVEENEQNIDGLIQKIIDLKSKENKENNNG